MRLPEYLKERCISEEIISQHNIHMSSDNAWIVIPIVNKHGIHLYNKYRQAPWYPHNNKVPKYKFDNGSHPELFNINNAKIEPGTKIYITEGEFDCMVLQSNRFNAVSSTGGSKMFKQNWADQLRECDIVFVYDGDEAGTQGMFKAGEMMGKTCGYVFLPPGEDVTSYVQKHGFVDTWDCFNYLRVFNLDVSSLKGVKQAANTLLEAKRELNNNREDSSHLDIPLEILRKNIEQGVSAKRRIAIHDQVNADVATLKKIPVSDFIKFDRTGMACCIWHNEKTPSLKYYPQNNSVYCFGCGKYGDIIEVIQTLHGLTFPEALTYLRGLKG